MRSRRDIQALLDALLGGLEPPRPVVELARLPHVAGVYPIPPAASRVLALPTLLGAGALLNFSTPAPDAALLGALGEAAAAAGAAQILVPHVRRGEDSRALREAGYARVPAGHECVVRLMDAGDVDELLRARIGARQLRDLRRRERACEAELTWELLRAGDLRDRRAHAEALVALHEEHARRHGGGHNPYNRASLERLLASELAPRIRLVFRAERRGGEIVVAGLLLVSALGDGIYYLTQAIRRDHEAARKNLYVSTFYRLYHEARRLRMDWVHLGRGGVDRKRRLGADLFLPLDHWIWSGDEAARRELASLGGPPPVDDEPSRHARPTVRSAPIPGPLRERGRPRLDEIDLSSNTNAWLGGCARYPDVDQPELKRRYLEITAEVDRARGAAELPRLSAENVLFTSGGVDAVLLLLLAFAEPGDVVCTTPPTFEAYAHWARLLRLEVAAVPLRGPALNELDVAAMVRARPKLVFLCDPNNPVGSRLSPEQVLELAAAAPGLVILDEAYVEFSERPSYLGALAARPNLVLVRTLSKAFGLAGARCGITLAERSIVRALERVQVPFGFSSPAQAAVAARLADMGPVVDSWRAVRRERERMRAALEASPAIARVYPSEANFLLVQPRDPARMRALLARENLRVAEAGHVVPGSLRISVARPEANQRFLDLLSDPAMIRAQEL
ncbi:aminotransferase class I/II [Sorangium cellulosum]|uniref:histidinol-phosphate transaminase n=1 Tax=Sorangium cellulosum TaxID=56 RepID=A0A4P2Q406_SORCE|nr:aminotransferase class I/II-fold pyridoxal phosphate-dependent enzyme [Sorangium cellulosum]AUX24087.1 aminotransferase class I/II [Sorangium cellulosum]